MSNLDENKIERPDNIEEYIAKGIYDLKWSDEFLIQRNGNFSTKSSNKNEVF